jgi:hypothetical protein
LEICNRKQKFLHSKNFRYYNVYFFGSVFVFLQLLKTFYIFSMKSIYTVTSIFLAILIIPTFFSFTKPYHFPGAPPTGYTGATGSYCSTSGCHSDFALNSSGGNVVAIGLPTTITLGATYNFSVVITHSAADREVFGFAVKAVNGSNVPDPPPVGTFSTTNPNAGVSINEISHRNAPRIPADISYTYTNLTWTAPTVAPVYPIKFYIVGNAGNRNNLPTGDYIYSTVVTAVQDVLPVVLSKFFANQMSNGDVNLQWRTEQELNTDKFDIERSSDGQIFYTVTTTKALGNSNNAKDYITIDKNPSTKGEYIYYRLKMFDSDGTFKYSEIVKLTLTTKETIIKNIATVHNAINNSFEVNILSPNTQSLNINWVNSNGQIITRETKVLVKGANTFILRNTGLAKGEVVYLQFTNGVFSKSYTVVN